MGLADSAFSFMGVLQLGQFFISFITGEMPFRQAALDHDSLGAETGFRTKNWRGIAPAQPRDLLPQS
jgi:hypothetical protein